MYSEFESIKAARKILEKLVKSLQADQGIPSDFAMLGIKKLKDWEESYEK